MSSKVKFHVRKKRVKSSPIRTTKEQRKKQKAAKRKKKRLLSQQTQNKQRTTTKRLKLILRPNSNVSNHNHHPQRNNNSRVAVRSRSSQFDLDPDSENENMASANTPSALEKALAEAAKYKRLYHAEAQKVAAKNMDIYKLINEGALDSDHQGVDKAHLSIGGLTHINFVSQNTFEPWFIQATRDLVKIRMKCQILRNSKGLPLLTKILNLYCDALKQPRFNFNVGGTSYGSLDRVMQYKSFKLFTFETAVVIQKKYLVDESVFALHHDEMSAVGNSIETVVLVFNTINTDIDTWTPSSYCPRTRMGNIVRTIWNHQIPSKTARDTVQYAIKPAVDGLDRAGGLLYGNEWLKIRDLMG
eukprot:50615_1